LHPASPVSTLLAMLAFVPSVHTFSLYSFLFFFFFTDTATTEIYTLSLHDALPISLRAPPLRAIRRPTARRCRRTAARPLPPNPGDRKSTRLNSSHSQISYAVFCLKKKKKKKKKTHRTIQHKNDNKSSQYTSC